MSAVTNSCGKLSNSGLRQLRPIYSCHFVSGSTYSILVATNKTDSQSLLISFPSFASQLPSRLLRIDSFVLPSCASQLPSSSFTDSFALLFASQHSLHVHLRIRSFSFRTRHSRNFSLALTTAYSFSLHLRHNSLSLRLLGD